MSCLFVSVTSFEGTGDVTEMLKDQVYGPSTEITAISVSIFSVSLFTRTLVKSA